MVRQSLFMAAAGCMLSFASVAHAEVTVARFGTEFTGEGKCLDVINDPDRNKLVMGDCGNYSGQKWEITSDGQDGWLQLRNAFSGKDLCLDVLNDGNNDQVTMAQCAGSSGQAWMFSEPEGPEGFVRLTNDFTGEDKCLDIANDGNNNRLKLADCGDYSGQMWRVTPVK